VPRPFRTASLTGFKHSDLEMPNKADVENDIILEITKNFHTATVVFSVIMKMTM
jgi:hypothetical protein